MRVSFWPAVSALLLATGVIGAVANLRLRADVQSAEARSTLLLNAVSPARLMENLRFSAVANLDGAPRQFAEFMDDRPLILMMFRLTDCRPCLTHFEAVRELTSRFGQSINVIGVVVGDTASLTDLMRSGNIPQSELVWDQRGQLPWAFNGAATPCICAADPRTGFGFSYPLLDAGPETARVLRDGLKATLNMFQKERFE